MKASIGKGLVVSFLMLGMLLPALPILAEEQVGVSEALEVTTHPATNITATSATLHGYLGGLAEHVSADSEREPITVSLILQAGTPFGSIETLGIEEHAVLESASRIRPVTIASWAGDPDSIAVGDELVLELFPDALYTASVDRVTTDSQGTVSVRGRLPECPASYVLMSTHDGRTLASVRAPIQNLRYLVVYEPRTDRHYVAELDPDKVEGLMPSTPLIPPRPSAQEEQEIAEILERIAGGLGPEDPAIIDVMVLYTAAAAEWADLNNGGIHNVIAQAMAKAELVLENSDTGTSMRLVHSAQVDYDESQDTSSTHLWRLRATDDGYMDEVHDWRDQYGADLVALFAEVHDVSGVANLLNDIDGRPSSAFSLTRVQEASFTYTHIHEMGHNMGCHHHKDQNFQPGPTSWHGWPENTWSAGWRWTGQDGGHYCSVMTYYGGSYFDDGVSHYQVPHFSNPDILHEGQPTGHPVDGDNARTIREIKHVVAAYRESTAEVSVSFEWWSDPAHRKQTALQPMSAPGSFSARLTGLAPDTTYHVRARATIGDVAGYGDETEFTTEAAVVTEIWDWYGLNAIRDELLGSYLLMNDLDATTAGYQELAGAAANDGRGWSPIGTLGSPFIGTFKGQAHQIRDLVIARPDEDGVGLFRAIGEGGLIENVGLVNIDVLGCSYVGGLVGLNMWEASVSKSYASGKLDGQSHVGGLIGLNYYGTVSNSFASSAANGRSYVGGLVGSSYGTVSGSRAVGNVTGDDHIGGLIGGNFWGTVANCYSAGVVTGDVWVGGLVGTNRIEGEISNCYSMGEVGGGSGVGGLIGWNGGSVGNSFWDTETSGQADSDGGTGKTTAEIKAIATFTDTETEGLDEPWDVTTVLFGETDDAYIWNIVDGKTYPFLSWEQPAALAQIEGQIREVNCAILPGMTITMNMDDDEIASTVSDEDGYYEMAVPGPGEYTVVASKKGFRNEEQSVSVDELMTYTVGFVGSHGLIPNAPNMSYVLACINLWQSGEPPCKLTMSTVLAVINAWQFPVEEQAVHFPDPNLEEAIREAIHKPEGPIYPSDLQGLTSLDAPERSVADLTGLEHCSNLSELHLWGNEIGDLSPLAGVTNLTSLGLGDNQISDISPLADLTGLTWLGLGWNQIDDLSPLADLTNLTTLILADNQISDISPLAGLTGLTSLSLHSNQISDISVLVDNTGLGDGDTVDLRYNPLSEQSINEYIPTLEARGVTVDH